MSENEQPDYIFIECACDHSFEKNENNNRWINRIDGGVTIPENALLSVQYAGLNVLGSGSDVIEFKNQKIGESEIYKYNEATENYDKVKYDVFDNKVTIFLEFYKNQDGLYNYTLPYPHFTYSTTSFEERYTAYGNNKSTTTEEKQHGVTQSTYNSIYNYAFPIDNKRYTILKRNPNSKYSGSYSGREYNGIYFVRDMANYEYSIYHNEVEIEIDKGFISPSSIAQQISQQLDKHTEPKRKTMRCWIEKSDYTTDWDYDYQDIDGGIITETETFKLFDCATRRTFYQKASERFNEGDNYNDNFEVEQYQKNFEYIGCYNPSIFLTGRSILKDLSYDAKQKNYAILNQVSCEDEVVEGFVTRDLYTNIPYDKDILIQFHYLFQYQEKDSAMFETKPAKKTGSTAENSRFLHSDSEPLAFSSLAEYKLKRFGTDYSSSANDRIFFTNALYLTYFPQYENFQEDGAYGCFFPWKSSVDNKYYCRVYGRFYVGLDNLGDPYFDFYTDTTQTINTYGGNNTGFEPHLAYDGSTFPISTITYNRIGWDRHFSAHGNQCIMLWNGLTDVSELKAYFHDDQNDQPQEEHVFSNSFILNSTINSTKEKYYYDTGNDQIYLGADSFLFNFDTVESRFTMSQLHTSRKQFNNALSGFDASILTGVKTDDNTGQPKIYYSNIANAGHYTVQFPLDINPNANTGIYEISPTKEITSTQEVAENYQVMQTNVIFDSNCGIFFGFFGITEKTYENSLWDILGFSKTQTHTYLTEDLPLQEILYRNNRFLNSGVNLNQSQIYPFTTNAQINSNEIISWRSNPFNISYFNTLNIPNNFRVLTKISNHTFDYKDSASPYRVIQNQVSTLMFAEKLPRKTNIPFYQVRSDILPMVKYYGGNNQTNGRLPVLTLVNKSFSGVDYFVNQGDNSMEFIIKRRITINSVTTEIFDSNGKPAILDPHSSVIYKFQVPYVTPQITPFKTSAEYQESLDLEQMKKNKNKKKK